MGADGVGTLRLARPDACRRPSLRKIGAEALVEVHADPSREPYCQP